MNGALGRALAQHRAVEIVAGLRQQRQRRAQRGAVAARAVGDGQAIAAVEDVGRDVRGEGLQQFAFALIGGPAIGRQFGAGKEAADALIEAEEVVAVDPFEIEQQRQRLAHADVGKYRTPGVEHQEFRRLRHAGLDGVADHLAVPDGRKIIAVVPAQRLDLDAKIVEAALEGFELAVGLAIDSRA